MSFNKFSYLLQDILSLAFQYLETIDLLFLINKVNKHWNSASKSKLAWNNSKLIICNRSFSCNKSQNVDCFEDKCHIKTKYKNINWDSLKFLKHICLCPQSHASMFKIFNRKYFHELQKISWFINSSKNLISLEIMQSDTISTEIIDILLTDLQTNTYIKHLHLGSFNENIHYKKLSKLIKNTTTLETLDINKISDIEISENPDYVKIICDAVKQNKTLIHFGWHEFSFYDTDELHITNESIKNYFDIFLGNSTLKSTLKSNLISMSLTGITDSAVNFGIYIKNILESNNSVEKINISNNSDTITDFEYIADAFKNNNKITYLNLENNNIEYEKLKPFLNNLKTDTCLKYLNIKIYIKIMYHELKMLHDITDMIVENTSLETLILPDINPNNIYYELLISALNILFNKNKTKLKPLRIYVSFYDSKKVELSEIFPEK